MLSMQICKVIDTGRLIRFLIYEPSWYKVKKNVYGYT